MSLTLYAAFIVASLGLIALPGPNVGLIVATSLRYGRRYGLATVLGTTAAMLPQLALTILGARSLLETSATWFEVLRWAGVAYLLLLALRAWRASSVETPCAVSPRSVRESVLRGFLVSLTNPKTLLFYGAFLPQFVEPGPSAAGQMTLLAVTFVILALTLDSAWALLAGRLRGRVAMPARSRDRISAGFSAGAGLGLALARRT